MPLSLELGDKTKSFSTVQNDGLVIKIDIGFSAGQIDEKTADGASGMKISHSKTPNVP